jgi:hypothetical protein
MDGNLIKKKRKGFEMNPTLSKIESAQQDIEGAIANLNASLETADTVESLLILKHIEATANLRSDLDRLAWALRQKG